MRDWKININDGGAVGRVVFVRSGGAKAADPLEAMTDDLVTWADTTNATPCAAVRQQPKTNNMRSRFVDYNDYYIDYNDYYIIHCDILAHEDRGMITVGEVAR